jgi:phospholipase C
MSRIKHVVVLMLENRSFDHFLGALPGVDGIDPASPRQNLEAPNSTKAYLQSPGATPRLRPDPRHGNKHVLRQINDIGPMGGFVYDFAASEPRARSAWGEVMKYFDRGELPALHELAEAYCVCDRWFSSVPGPTWTNRFFVHSGTSKGFVDMPNPPIDWNLHNYDQTTIFDRLNEKHVSWRVYFGDIPHSLLLTHQRRRENLNRYRRLSKFRNDVAEAPGDSFPSYVFVEPDYFWPHQNDQHPPNDVLRGDALIAEIYNALRANEAIWDSTLLIVTYDEHGGLYDHVVPPSAQSPDGLNRDGFAFDRYGVRVPAVLISKWVRKGVFRVDPADGATLDHTSILKFLTRQHELGPLGERVANAADLEGALSDQPLAQCPASVGTSRLMDATATAENAGPMPPLNHNQAALVDFAESLERELDSPADEVKARILTSSAGLEGRVEAAKERVRALVQSSGLPPDEF